MVAVRLAIAGGLIGWAATIVPHGPWSASVAAQTAAQQKARAKWSGTWSAEYNVHVPGRDFDWSITDIHEHFDVELDLSIDDNGAIAGSGKARLARSWKNDVCQGVRVTGPGNTTCVTRCTGEYDFHSAGAVPLDISGHRDEAIDALVVELRPSSTAPQQTARINFTCVGENAPPPFPIQFDWFNCPARPSAGRHCATSARFMRVSIDEHSGVATLPQNQQDARMAPGYHGKVTVEGILPRFVD